MRIYTVYTTEGRLDRNYLVMAVSMEEAAEVIEEGGDGKVRNVGIADEEFMEEMEIAPEDIPTTPGEFKLYDEGT